MARKKETKIKETGDLSLNAERDFSLSIGAMLGKKPPAAAPEKKNPAPPAAPNLPAFWERVSKVVLRRESAGRGGKVVTVVECRPAPDGATATELARSMRRQMGCGSHVEGSGIVLQGDMRERAAAWLAKQGVKNVVMGN